MKLSFPIYRLKRQAKLLAREQNIALHLALDKVAQSEGFRSWSHLSDSQPQCVSVSALLAACKPGELVLLAARPGHGKTLLALDVLAEAIKTGRNAYFFTLEYNRDDLLAREESGIQIDTSDGICADHVTRTLRDVPEGAVAAIDYLQLLDQKREFPPLSDQVDVLKRLAKARGITILALSQIDRRFEAIASALPGFDDIRLPNPVDLSLISKACFLHDGRARLETQAA